jgi:2-amino-4-hydroxy-6-hydroxymethyldihydropteridine diphosphokinase
MLKLKLKEPEMTYNYLLSLGSNIEPRRDNLIRASEALKSIGKILIKSSIYETEAWGNKNQSNFYNAVINFQSSLSPKELLQAIKSIEKSMGRIKSYHWGPREIDIDIIICKDYTLQEPDLEIPHPGLTKRRFVLEPMFEVDKNYMLSDSNKSITDLLTSCEDRSSIYKLDLSW